jgi:hypothetical protein
MTASILTHDYGTCDTCQALEQEIIRLRTLLISPGWGVPVAGETLNRVRILARGSTTEATHADVFMGDLDYLKQWNIAAGSQERTNEFVRPALTLRLGDCLVIGQVDGADMFMLAFPAGQGDAGMASITERLKAADITDAERNKFAQAVCRRREGPLAGDIRYALHRAGWRISTPLYPTITTTGYYNVPVDQIETIFLYGDKAVFDQKAARGVGR